MFLAPVGHLPYFAGTSPNRVPPARMVPSYSREEHNKIGEIMRKTKIICTIGPSSDSKEVLKKMCEAGMDTARLNFSHGTHEDHQQKIDLIKSVREELNIPLPIMLDTKGPEYRIGLFENDSIVLNDGDTFTLTSDDIVGDNTKVSVSYSNLINELEVGMSILVNDGLVELCVEKIEGNNAICKVVIGGKLSNRKSMCFPGKVFNHEFLSQQDKEDILFGIKNDVDFVAASFVSNADNARELREFLDNNGGERICLIAKIENSSGVENVDEIFNFVDGIMVARGDLGVEIPFREVPAIQKMLIQKCRIKGKRVITATEMLESMIEKPRPTRAEVSDVANAVYDGSSAIMLSGETANGKYPVESINAMSNIAEFTENKIHYEKRFKITEYQIKNTLDAISHSTCAMAIDVDAKAIVVNSISGQTARMVSRFRCPAPILGTTTDKKIWHQLNLSWGVTPVLNHYYDSQDLMFMEGLESAVKLFNLNPGDKVVLTGGKTNGTPGNTNTVRIETIK